VIPAKIVLTRDGVDAAIREYLERRGVVVGLIEFPWLDEDPGPDPTVATVATDLDEPRRLDDTSTRLGLLEAFARGWGVCHRKNGESPASNDAEVYDAAWNDLVTAARKAGGSMP